jgi:predicted RNase H-like nuclease (RuvC/YqgF family)
VVAWIASTMMMAGDAPVGSPREMSSLLAKVTALEKTVVSLEERIAKVGSDLERAGARVGALESRKPSTTPESGDTAALEKGLRDAARRIADLERRNSASATAAERIDALTARLHRLEGATRASTASPPPAPPAGPAPAAPAPIPGPASAP